MKSDRKPNYSDNHSISFVAQSDYSQYCKGQQGVLQMNSFRIFSLSGTSRFAVRTFVTSSHFGVISGLCSLLLLCCCSCLDGQLT